jgi:hypothetical protein
MPCAHMHMYTQLPWSFFHIISLANILYTTKNVGRILGGELKNFWWCEIIQVEDSSAA